jgi:aerobic carbon-monoxide dehydrogenase medium subunit
VKPPSFKYFAAQNVEEVLALLAEHGGEARVLAGGQSLVQEMNVRRTRPRVLVDLNRVPGLDFVQDANGSLLLGSMTRTSTVERDAPIAASLPLLAEAAARVGHVAVRNRGTVGGNVAHADPAANLPPVMLVLDAEFTVRSENGERVVAAADFFKGAHVTALEPTEFLTGLRLAKLPPGAGSAFVEISRRGRGWGLGGVAAVVSLADDGTVADARIGLSGMAQTALRANEAEDAMRGREPSTGTWTAAAEAAVRTLNPPADIHASSEYRRHLAGALVRRALAVAGARAEGR